MATVWGGGGCHGLHQSLPSTRHHLSIGTSFPPQVSQVADTLALELAAKIPGCYESKVGEAIRLVPEPIGTVHLALSQ